MTKVIIHGSKGRMGQMLIACGKKIDGLEIVAGVDEGDSLAHHLADCDAVIDFSLHNTRRLRGLCAEHGKARSSAPPATRTRRRRKCSSINPPFHRLGEQLFDRREHALLAHPQSRGNTGTDFDLEVIKMHHRHKVDAPSGSRRSVILLEVRNQQRTPCVTAAKALSGAPMRRSACTACEEAMWWVVTPSCMPVPVNDWSSQEAASRETFANGALRAAQWANGKAPGFLTCKTFWALSKPAYIALGSNLGDTAATLQSAFAELQTLSRKPIKQSSLWRSTPVDCPPDSPDFINAAAALTPLDGETPESLLARLQALEVQFGRQPKVVMNEPRPLDLDLIAFGDEQCQGAQLTLPHPRFQERRFVLEPLAEIAPEAVLPGQSGTVAELLARLEADETLTCL